MGDVMKLRKGVTLIELMIALPLISIILIITYNMLFLSSKSFRYTNDTFMVGEDIRTFTTHIQKEARQAKKATNEKDGADQIAGLHKPLGTGDKELYIYTDLDDDGKPELIRYRLLNNQIMRAVETTKKGNAEPKFPYQYEEAFKDEKVVLSNIINDDIFGAVEEVGQHEHFNDPKDHRRKVRMKIEVSTGEGNSPIIIHTVLTNKSRNEFDD